MANLILPRRRSLLVPSFAAGLAAAMPSAAIGHNGGPPLATDAEVARVVEQAKGAGIVAPWGTLPSDPSLAMFMMAKMAMARVGGEAVPGLNPQDVFSSKLYTGTGNTNQTLTTGVDLSTFGGLLWCKIRASGQPHSLWDSARGVSNYLVSNTTAAQGSASSSFGPLFTTTGFTLQRDWVSENTDGQTGIGWSFCRAAKFFDVVTYTGNGTARTIAHALGVAPGLIIIKRTDNGIGGTNWRLYHRSSSGNYLNLDTTGAASADPGTIFGNDSAPVAPTSAVFSVGSNSSVNGNTGTFVAYLFAHDADPSGVVQCGTFTTASGSATVTLGWRPQYLLAKRTNGTGGWFILDTARGWTSAADDNYLQANTSSAEATTNLVYPEPTGFYFPDTTGNTYVYMAIREPV